ncbi:c-type cytochrome [Ramlibacter tataouinensis]|uniref:c-type cytochrome n=1 Tax=Ramlibacter tataouinensis TaxID=94132 RepID=UPI0022F3E313|nr:c-type cytochrome [Ramlibacter tataouinensis]WBY03541.1 c-type cytochrome [Ramlibacter tataouinensis]
MKLHASLFAAALLAAVALDASAQATPAAPAASAAAPAAAAQPAKIDAAEGEKRYAAVCAACHAADGNSTIAANPKLAQQHPEYLVKQLHDFKDGKRASPVMQGFAAQLADQDMRNISAFLGAAKAKPGFAKDKELVTLGERIYRGGVPDRQIAACASCHSPNGAGIPAQYPRLSGQHADYTAAQLAAFRDGARKNSPQMTDVAAKLNDREIRAVSDYIAGLR